MTYFLKDDKLSLSYLFEWKNLLMLLFKILILKISSQKITFLLNKKSKTYFGSIFCSNSW